MILNGRLDKEVNVFQLLWLDSTGYRAMLFKTMSALYSFISWRLIDYYTIREVK